MINLRFISAIALTGGRGEPGEVFMSTTTEAALEEAEKDYREWRKRQDFNLKQSNKVDDIISALTDAYEQKAHEDGFRLGVRLMIECLCPETGYGVSSKT